MTESKQEARARYLSTGECKHLPEHAETVTHAFGTVEKICGVCGKRHRIKRGQPYETLVEEVLTAHGPLHVSEIYKKLPKIAESSIRRVLSTKKDTIFKRTAPGVWTINYAGKCEA